MVLFFFLFRQMVFNAIISRAKSKALIGGLRRFFFGPKIPERFFPEGDLVVFRFF
jgi:hypothetical protein